MINYPVLIYIFIFSLALPVFASIYRLKVINREMKILAVYIGIAFAVTVCTTWLIKNPLIEIGVWHVNVLIEYIFIMSIIIFWQESRVIRKFLKVLLFLFILFWICAKLTFEPLSGLYSITASVSQAILALSAGYTLFIVIGNHTQPLLNHQRFWVLLSFVICYTGTLMPFTLAGILFTKPGEALFSLWYINWTLGIITNSLFTIGFLCPQTQP